MTNRNKSSKGLIVLSVVCFAMLALVAQPSWAGYLETPSAYWKLDDDPSGGVILDSIDTAGNGTCTNCPVSTNPTPGQVGDGYYFDGTNDIVTFPGTLFDFADGASFSIELWMKRDGAINPPDANTAFIGRPGVSPTPAWWLGFNATGQATMALWDDSGSGGGAFSASGTTVLTDGEWHHIAMVRDGASGDNMKLYVDGVLEAEGGSSKTDGHFISGNNVTLGAQGAALLYKGQLDNVAVYSATALSAAVVAQSYRNGLADLALDEDAAAAFADASVSVTIAVGYETTLSSRAVGNPLPTYASQDLPDGATIDDPIVGDITWLPTDLQTGDNVFDVTASNSVGSDTQTWTVTVEDFCTSGIDAYWKLDDDPSGGVILDSIDTAGNGTCTNCPVSTNPTPGQVGDGYYFDGTNDIVTFPGTLFDFADGASFSIELWMKRDGAINPPDANTAFIGRPGVSPTPAWWLGFNATGQATMALWDDSGSGGGAFSASGTTVLTDGEWHHIAMVRDGASGDNMKLYVDGVLEAEGGSSKTDGHFISGNNVTLGAQGAALLYKGQLDEVAVYSMALPQTVIAQHATAASDQYYCNGAPTITSTAVTIAEEGVAYSYTATATDPDGHTVTWSLTTAPSGMTINASTGAVAWTPGDNENVSTPVEILAADTYGATASQGYTITVTTINDPPVITAQATLTTTINTPLTIELSDLTVTDPDNSYPTGFTLMVAVGSNYTVSGTTITPATDFTGDLTVPVQVSDGVDTSAVFDLTVTVTGTSNSAPVISSTAPTTATVGTAYEYDAEATDADGDTLTWALSGAPSGMTVNSTTGLVAWTPTADDEGDVTYTLSVSDGNGGSDSESVTVTVSAASTDSGGGGGGGGCFINSLGF